MDWIWRRGQVTVAWWCVVSGLGIEAGREKGWGSGIDPILGILRGSGGTGSWLTGLSGGRRKWKSDYGIDEILDTSRFEKPRRRMRSFHLGRELLDWLVQILPSNSSLVRFQFGWGIWSGAEGINTGKCKCPTGPESSAPTLIIHLPGIYNEGGDISKQILMEAWAHGWMHRNGKCLGSMLTHICHFTNLTGINIWLLTDHRLMYWGSFLKERNQTNWRKEGKTKMLARLDSLISCAVRQKALPSQAVRPVRWGRKVPEI